MLSTYRHHWHVTWQEGAATVLKYTQFHHQQSAGCQRETALIDTMPTVKRWSCTRSTAVPLKCVGNLLK